MKPLIDEICDSILLTAAVKMIVYVALAACCSGCIDSVASIVNPTSDVPNWGELLNDASEHSKQPTLPDDFKKPEGGTGAAPPVEIVSKIECTVYGPPGCVPCDKAIKEGNESKRFHFVKSDKIPKGIAEFAEKWNQGGYPVVTFWDRNNVERCVAPWRGLIDFEKRYDRTVKPTKPPAQASVGPLAGSHYPTHGGMIYDFEGNRNPSREFMIRYLMSGQHAGRFNESWLRSLWNHELVALHDDDHMHKIRSQPMALAQPRQKSRAKGNCPNGMCPL